MRATARSAPRSSRRRVRSRRDLTAEGQKQAAVLRAQGVREATILEAEGQGEGDWHGLRGDPRRNPDPQLLAYQYSRRCRRSRRAPRTRSGSSPPSSSGRSPDRPQRGQGRELAGNELCFGSCDRRHARLKSCSRRREAQRQRTPRSVRRVTRRCRRDIARPVRGSARPRSGGLHKFDSRTPELAGSARAGLGVVPSDAWVEEGETILLLIPRRCSQRRRACRVVYVTEG